MTTYQGLTAVDVLNRQKKYGLNVLQKNKRFSVIERLLKKIANPLLLILLFSSLLSAYLGQTTDFFIILSILLVSIILDAYQESQAENAADKLSRKIELSSEVMRDGKQLKIKNTHLTVGDVVLLSAGNVIPADCQLLESRNLEVNQAVLTGESFPVEKEVDDFILMGTHVVSGYAVAQVSAIGRLTQIGKISTTLTQVRPQTEFENGLNNFSFLLIRLTFVFSIILFVVNVILGHQFIASLMFVLAIAIGFAPELLPMILTVNLAKGSIRLSRQGVIVKFLPAIENLGSMDVLCTDKTGTLTQGIMALKDYFGISGKTDQNVITAAFLNSYFQSGYRNPIDEAILDKKINIDKKYQKIDEITYDFYRRRSSVFLKIDSHCLMVCKGAPDSVLPLCDNTSQLKIDFEALNRQGFRTIVVASKELPLKSRYTDKDEAKLKCLGVLVFADPPKNSVLTTLNRLKELGVDLKILTGDNEVVAAKVCQEVGIETKNILTGQQIENMTEGKLMEQADTTTIFASLNPDQKLLVISTLKKLGHVVGYLGDGINDSPSLKNADVGISVNNAVDVAKESADIVLLHKDLKVLQLGIEEGRATFANIMKYILMGTSSTFGNILSLSLASIFLPFLPLLPVQLLLNDLLYDFSQILLVKDNVDPSVVLRPYRWNINYIKKFMVVFGSLSSIFDLITFFLLYVIFKASIPVFQTGWFMESFVSQMLVILSIRTTLVPFWKSKTNPVFLGGILLILFMTLSFVFSPLNTYFHFQSPSLITVLIISTLVLTYISLTELTKYFFYKNSPRYTN